jgi:hypothetical protein
VPLLALRLRWSAERVLAHVTRGMAKFFPWLICALVSLSGLYLTITNRFCRHSLYGGTAAIL